MGRCSGGHLPEILIILERSDRKTKAEIAALAANAVTPDPIEAEAERIAKHRERLIE